MLLDMFCWIHLLVQFNSLISGASSCCQNMCCLHIEVIGYHMSWAKSFPNISLCSVAIMDWSIVLIALQWHHNGCDGVSNRRPHHCLLNSLFRRRSKKTPKIVVTGLCVGNSPVAGDFPAQMAGNAENIFFWWRHHIFLGFLHWQNETHKYLEAVTPLTNME